MSRFLYALSFLALTFLACPSTRADDSQPKPEGEKIPAPKAKVAPIYIFVPPPRSDTRDVWQHYGVNSQGRFVPRVISTPNGAFYSRNLDPYPWTQNRTTSHMPYAD